MPFPNPRLAAFLQDICEREEKYFKVYDTYTPDFNKTMLTGKFYSKYEVPSMEEPDPELMRKITKAKYGIPREKYPWPLTENQRYGWFTDPLVQIDHNDSRFHHPRRGTDFIKHELKLKLDESVLPKTKFNGIPFKVQ